MGTRHIIDGTPGTSKMGNQAHYWPPLVPGKWKPWWELTCKKGLKICSQSKHANTLEKPAAGVLVLPVDFNLCANIVSSAVRWHQCMAAVRCLVRCLAVLVERPG